MAAIDPLANRNKDATQSGDDWVDITPDDDEDLEKVPRAIYSHDGGVIVCQSKNGNTRAFLFAEGEIKPLRPSRIMATNTTSTDIVAIY